MTRKHDNDNNIINFTNTPHGKPIKTAPIGERINAYFPEIKACVAIRYYGDGAGWTFDDGVDYDFGTPTHWEPITSDAAFVVSDAAFVVTPQRSPFSGWAFLFAVAALVSVFVSVAAFPVFIAVWAMFTIAGEFWRKNDS